MREVVTTEGKRISLDEWQEMKGLDMHHVCAAFTIDHPIMRNIRTYYEPMLDILDHVANEDKYRTQIAIPDKNDTDLTYNYCTVEGMGFHLYYAGTRKRYFYMKEIPLILLRLGYKARVKFHVQETSTVYIDVAPMYYQYGKPFANQPHEEEWEEAGVSEEDCWSRYSQRAWKLKSKYLPFLTKKEKLIYG